MMRLVKYNPRNIGTFDSLLDRFFQNEFEGNQVPATFAPQVDVSETDKFFEIELAIPGMKKEDFKLDFLDGKLTISGERKQEENQEGKNYHTRETRYGAFSRSFYLPDTVNEGKIKAAYENGILNINIPKDEKKSLSRTIEVK